MIQEPFPEKILIVDDEETIRDYLQKLLSLHGYTVKTASTGTDAIQLISDEYFPVIIADLFLPDFRGTEILDYLQKRSVCTAVLIITAYKSVDTVIESLRRGAYDYITKPFSQQILLHRIARAMEKIRLEKIASELSSKIIYTTEEERQRISREIHDGIGQSLTIIKMTLQAIKNKMADPKDLSKEIDGLADYVEETMVELSRISRDLSPTYVSEVGLPQALRLYLDTFSRKTGIKVHSSLPGAISFHNSQQEMHIYRIAQEALTNIARHSGATGVEISLVPEKDRIFFSISDNGSGFSDSREGYRSGLGLIGIRERAAELGGEVLILTRPGSGTTIRLEVPYVRHSS